VGGKEFCPLFREDSWGNLVKDSAGGRVRVQGTKGRKKESRLRSFYTDKKEIALLRERKVMTAHSYAVIGSFWGDAPGGS